MELLTSQIASVRLCVCDVCVCVCVMAFVTLLMDGIQTSSLRMGVIASMCAYICVYGCIHVYDCGSTMNMHMCMCV